MKTKKIEVGKYAGFCGGVELCINKLEKLVEKHKNLYCLGEIVHNSEVIKYFKDKGLIIVDSLDEVKSDNLVIRAHGTEKNNYEIAKHKNIKLHDLTCPKVLNIRTIVKDYLNDETYIILIAKHNHPETISTISFCGNNSSIIETEEEINKLIPQINNFKNILIIGQTTFNEELFKKYTNIIKEKLIEKNIIVKNTICNATSIRQKEVERLSKEKDCMIIIGGKNSSNTQKLYEISLKNCPNSFLITIKDELDLEKINKFNNIGIMAGASTPKKNIEEVIEFLEKGE